MFHLRSIGVLSAARIFAVVQAAIGVLVGFFFLVFGAVGAALVPGQRKIGMLGIIIIAVLMPVFYGILGFVLGAIWAFVYNSRRKPSAAWSWIYKGSCLRRWRPAPILHRRSKLLGVTANLSAAC